MRFDSGFIETSEKKILSDLKSEKMKIFLTVFEGHLPICKTLSIKHLLDSGIMIASNARALRILYLPHPLLFAFQHPSSILSSLENEDLFLVEQPRQQLRDVMTYMLSYQL